MIDAIRRALRRIRPDRGSPKATEPAPPQFGCRLEPLESERGFRVIGELDLYYVQEVKEALMPHLQGTVVLDLSDLSFIDDDGLGLLLGAFKRLRKAEGSLVLRNPRSEIMRLFDITGISQIPDLTIEADPCSTR